MKTSKIEKDIREDLEANPVDGFNAVLRSIPIPGPAQAAELFAVFFPVLEKRQNTWIIKLDDAVKILSQRIEGLTWETLAGKPDFVDVFLRASQAANRTHREEKLEALRNAVLNSAIHTELSGDKQMMFVSYVEDLTPSHLEVLTILSGTKEWFIRHKSEVGISPDPLKCEGFPFQIEEFIGYGLPRLKAEPEMCVALVQDLITRGLLRDEVTQHTLYLFHGEIVNPNSVHVLGADPTKTKRELLRKLGKEFLAYVTSPSMEVPSIRESPQENRE